MKLVSILIKLIISTFCRSATPHAHSILRIKMAEQSPVEKAVIKKRLPTKVRLLQLFKYLLYNRAMIIINVHDQ